MMSMGMPESELATQHTSEEVGNMLGELMNQIVGDFTGNVGSELMVSINQNQPKMLTINKEVVVSIDTNLDRAQARRVSFTTAKRNVFYMELAMDRTEFIQLHEFEREEIDPDRIVEEDQAAGGNTHEHEQSNARRSESARRAGTLKTRLAAPRRMALHRRRQRGEEWSARLSVPS
jgi:hypothetical protein